MSDPWPRTAREPMYSMSIRPCGPRAARRISRYFSGSAGCSLCSCKTSSFVAKFTLLLLRPVGGVQRCMAVVPCKVVHQVPGPLRQLYGVCEEVPGTVVLDVAQGRVASSVQHPAYNPRLVVMVHDRRVLRGEGSAAK